MRSRKPRRRRCRPRAAGQHRRRSRICWCRSIAIICHCIVRARFTRAMVSISTVPLCATGLARLSGCCNRLSTPFGSTSLPPRKSTATTPRFQCCHRGSGAPRPDDYGSMYGTIDPSVVPRRRPLPIFTAPIAAASTRHSISPVLPGSSRPMPIPGSRRFTISPPPSMQGSARSLVGRTAAASSTTSGRARNHLSPGRRSSALPPSIGSKRRRSLPLPQNAWRCEPRPSRSSRRSSIGLGKPSPRCRLNRTWPKRFATPSNGAKHCRGSSPMPGSKSTTTSLKMRCAASRCGVHYTPLV
jgi:hypothetical protein